MVDLQVGLWSAMSRFFYIRSFRVYFYPHNYKRIQTESEQFKYTLVQAISLNITTGTLRACCLIDFTKMSLMLEK